MFKPEEPRNREAWGLMRLDEASTGCGTVEYEAWGLMRLDEVAVVGWGGLNRCPLSKQSINLSEFQLISKVTTGCNPSTCQSFKLQFVYSNLIYCYSACANISRCRCNIINPLMLWHNRMYTSCQTPQLHFIIHILWQLISSTLYS